MFNLEILKTKTNNPTYNVNNLIVAFNKELVTTPTIAYTGTDKYTQKIEPEVIATDDHLFEVF